jgi:methylphosphotriester-DNA--protein-cysteine methyltransferase
MNHRQWKKNYKKRYGYNPPAYMDKRKRRKARAQQSLPCAGISVEQITQAMATSTEAVFTAAGNICDALAHAFSRQAQAFNAAADQYKDDKAGAVHGK